MPDLSRFTPLLVVVAIGAALWLLSTTAPPPAPTTRGAGAYAPVSAEPRDAIPGGSLRAHEGIRGAHTVERHVGRTREELARRAVAEHLREVSTWPDLETADRAVAEALFRARVAIARWLATDPRESEDFEVRLDEATGTVWRRARREAVPARTVLLVLAPSGHFPEGFRIHTAYTRTP
jgi:hypothetical protein